MNNRHIWEGWTVQDFINDLEPTFNMINDNRSWQKRFTSRDEVKKWCMENQPGYKKYVKEVVDYFWERTKKY
jgi:hypothetical protein